MSIPYITHQIWLQGWDKLPQKFQENVELLTELNPEFEHKRWDEESLRKECELLGKPYADKFNSFQNFMAKVDYGRYVFLYHYGGFSIDTDMYPIKSLRETPGLDTDEFIVSKLGFPATIMGYVNSAIFIVRPRHPIMKEIIDTITTSRKTEKDYLTKELYVNSETGPGLINSIVQKHKKDITILDNVYFEPCYSVDPYCKVDEKSILDHQHSMSWVNPFFKEIFRYIFWIYRNILIVIAVILIIYIIFTTKGIYKSLRRFR